MRFVSGAKRFFEVTESLALTRCRTRRYGVLVFKQPKVFQFETKVLFPDPAHMRKSSRSGEQPHLELRLAGQAPATASPSKKI
jgi:hypothetical protein